MGEQANSVVGNLDTMACDGMDQLTEKVPALKEATPMFVESTKTSLVNCLTLVAEYLASFPVGQLALKVTALELDTVDVVLNDVLGNSEKNIIEEASLLGALAEVTGINFLLSLLGIKMVPHEEEGAVVPVAGEVVPDVVPEDALSAAADVVSAATPDAGVPASPAKPIDAALVEEEELVTRTTEDDLPTSS